MIHGHACFCHDHIVMLDQQIIIIHHSSCRRVLDGNHRIVCFSALHIIHGIFPCFYMVSIHIIAKILHGSCMAVCAFHSLIDHLDLIFFQRIHHGKSSLDLLPMLFDDLILQAAADGHQLGK